MNISTEPQATRGYTFNTELLPDDDEGQAFAQRIYSMLVEYAELTTRRRESDIAKYSSEHEAVVMERRKLEKQESRMQDEQKELMNASVEVEQALRDARLKLRQARNSGVPDPMWSLPADVAEYNARIARAEQSLHTANQRQSEYNNNVAGWRERQIKLQEQIDNLRNEVEQVWIKLERAKGNKAITVDRKTGMTNRTAMGL